MKYIASCSFGKDSLAAIIVRAEHGEQIDGAVYCRIMFDNDTSAELPEHEDWIHTYAIPTLKSRYGITTTIVQAQKSYCDYFYSTFVTGRKIGRIYGFPYLNGAWCNNRLKMRPLDAWQKSVGEYKAIVGIAADEAKRKNRDTVKGKILPLVDYNITEKEAFDVCLKAGLLSPAYNKGRCRLGCWFCHNQRVAELRRLRREYPVLWAKLMQLDRDSPVAFKVDRTLAELGERFAAEDMQVTMFDFMVVQQRGQEHDA